MSLKNSIIAASDTSKGTDSVFREAQERYFEYYGSEELHNPSLNDMDSQKSILRFKNPSLNSTPGGTLANTAVMLAQESTLDCLKDPPFQPSRIQKPIYKSNGKSNNLESQNTRKNYPSDPFASDNRVRPSYSVNEIRNKRKSEKRNTYFNPFMYSSNQNFPFTDGSGLETLNGKIFRDTYNRHLSLTFLHVLEESNELLKQIKSNIKQNYDSLDTKKPTHRQTKSAPYKSNQDTLKTLHLSRANRQLACNQSGFEAYSELNDETKLQYAERRESFGVAKSESRNSSIQHVSFIAHEEALDSETQNKSSFKNLDPNVMFNDSLNTSHLALFSETSKMMNECQLDTLISKRLFRIPAPNQEVFYNKRYLDQSHATESAIFEDKLEFDKAANFMANETEIVESADKFRGSYSSKLTEIVNDDVKSKSMSSLDKFERARKQAAYSLSGQNNSQQGNERHEILTKGNRSYLRNRHRRNIAHQEESKASVRLYTIEDEAEETSSTHRTPLLIRNIARPKKINPSQKNGPEEVLLFMNHNLEMAKSESQPLHSTSKILNEQVNINRQDNNESNPKQIPTKLAAIGVEYSAFNSSIETKTLSACEVSPEANHSKKLREEKSINRSTSKNIKFKKSDSAKKQSLNPSEIQLSKSFQRSDKENNSGFENYKTKRKDWFQSVYDNLKRPIKSADISTFLPPQSGSRSIGSQKSKETRLSFKI